MRSLIDFRARPFTAEYAKMLAGDRAVETVMRKLGTELPPTQNVEEFITFLKSAGVAHAVFTGREAPDGSRSLSNEYVAEVVARHPDMLTGFAGINPMGGLESLRKTTYVIEKLGLRGVCIDPFRYGVQADDRRLYPVYARCAELNVAIVVTLGGLPFQGPYLKSGDPAPLDNVATDFPELTIVCDHAGWPWITETIAIAYRHEKVYVDTSMYFTLPGVQTYVEAANTIIPGKFLFASAYPLIPIERAVSELEQLPFADGVLDHILYDNAAALLRRLGVSV